MVFKDNLVLIFANKVEVFVCKVAKIEHSFKFSDKIENVSDFNEFLVVSTKTSAYAILNPISLLKIASLKSHSQIIFIGVDRIISLKFDSAGKTLKVK